jgi:hypothetical protein
VQHGGENVQPDVIQPPAAKFLAGNFGLSCSSLVVNQPDAVHMYAYVSDIRGIYTRKVVELSLE